MWSVVHIEGREKEDVRDHHASDVQSEPSAPQPSSRSSSDDPSAEGQNAEHEQVRVLWPPKDGESSHRQEDQQETPVVNGASRRMTTGAFGGQHGRDPCNGAQESRGHMYRHNTEEYR
jgi:hypothetical protein